MRSSKPISLFLLLLALGLLVACGGGGGGGSDSSPPSTSPSPTNSGPPEIIPPAGNVMTLTVNGSTCSPATSADYPNKPCVAITMCDASGANCQTINDILLDAGDYGLRIFQQALNGPILSALNQNPVLINGLPLYDCVGYGDNSTVWGAGCVCNHRH